MATHSVAFSGNLEQADSIVAVLRWRAEHQPERVAYRYLADGEAETASFTYGALDAAARGVAAALQAVAEPGDRVLLLYPPGLEFVVAFFGCLYASMIAVPAYPPTARKSSIDRLCGIAGDAGASVAATTAGLLPKLSAIGAATSALERLRWLATDTAQAGDAWTPTHPGVDDVALLQYTSGSTGTPKGVIVSHGNIVSNSLILLDGFELSTDSVSVTWLPSFHDMGLIDGIVQPVFTGFLGVVMPPAAFLQRPARWLEAISRYGGTHAGGPNFAYELATRRVTTEERARLRLDTWVSAYNGAEPISAEVIDRFAEMFAPAGFSPLFSYPCYGLAEGTLMVTGCGVPHAPAVTAVDAAALRGGVVLPTAIDATDARRLVSSGRPWRDTRVAIVDPETHVERPEATLGEIWASGSTIAQGYWGRSAETAETFGARIAGTDEGPFLRTGDLGFVRDGELYVAGRMKDLIIVRGRNHYPQDIETTVARAHAALRAGCGAAFGLEINGEERLVIAQEVERQSLSRLEPEPVYAEIRRAVAEEHDVAVERILLLTTASIPKTSSGKIQRRTCRDRYLDGTLSIVGEWAADAERGEALAAEEPASASAQHLGWLRERVAALLDTTAERLSVTEPLARYGLDSMRAVMLSGEIAGRLGRDVPPAIAYEHPSLEALARWMLDGRVAASESETANTAPAAGEPLAIVGMSARFPGAPSLGAFWQLLIANGDGVHAVPEARRGWASPFDGLQPAPGGAQRAGFVDGIDLFDAELFNIAPREADAMDPQQRMLLEGAWEALEHAGMAPTSLAGSSTGVFVGVSAQDYFRRQQRAAPDLYTGTGNGLSIAANRISYVLDLRGPSMVVDTACSSSLVALHVAAAALRRRECDTAIVGGVNALLDPTLTAAFAGAGMLAPDGRCKTFDAAADGYVRGEGCGVLVVKRLSDAARDGDHVHAVLRGTAVTQDGRSNGLTAPRGDAQEAVIRAALRDAGVAPREVRYVEAHGTGTSLGDPIEFDALQRALGEQRGPEEPCYVGSVKPTVGHLEAAAGMAGIIKTVLALGNGLVPPHAHVQRRNPAIRLDGTPFKIPQRAEPWPAGRRIAGVSAFGFGGTNAHAVLESAPARGAEAVPPPFDATAGAAHVALISARTRAALIDNARRLAAHLRAHADLDVGAVCAALANDRAWLTERVAVVCANAEQLADALDAFVASGAATHQGVYMGTVHAEPAPARPASDTADAFAAAWVREPMLTQPSPYRRGTSRAELPTYAFDRRRHWVGEQVIATAPEQRTSEPPTPPADETRTAEWRAIVRTTTQEHRLAMMTDYLEAEVRRVTGRTDRVDVTAGFFELGLDSLMAVELRNSVERRLEIRLSATVAFDYSSIEELAAYLGELVERAEERAAAKGSSNGGSHPSTLPSVIDADLELAEIERLLAMDERRNG